MKESDCPLPLWDYCLDRRVMIHNLTEKYRFNIHGINTHTDMLGETGDISNIYTYKWYAWCYFRENTEGFPFNREILGRILGPAKGEGNKMAQWVLKANGQVVPRRTARPLKFEETHYPVETKKWSILYALIERRWGTAMKSPNLPVKQLTTNGKNLKMMMNKRIEDTVDAYGRLLNQQPAYDKLIHNEVQLQLEDKVLLLQVELHPRGTKRKPVMSRLIQQRHHYLTC